MPEWERCPTALESRPCRTYDRLHGPLGGTPDILPEGGTSTVGADILLGRLIAVDICAYGASPHASEITNDAAIARAVAAANADGGVLYASIKGTYDVHDNIPALTTAGGIDLRGSILRCTDLDQTGAFLTIGSLVLNGHQSMVISGVRVKRANLADWSDATQIGVLLRCLQNTTGDIAEVDGFKIGVRCQGEYDGTTAADFVHNKITLGRIWRCQHALNLHSESAASAGAVNNNRFYGGDITAQTGVNTSMDRYGWSFTRATGGYANHNTNLWIGPSFQHARTGSGVAYLAYSEVNATQNKIVDARAEWTAPAIMRGSLTASGGGANRIQVDYATSYLPTELKDVIVSAGTKAAWRTRNDRYSGNANDATRPVILVPDLRAELFGDYRDGTLSYGFDRLHIVYTTAPAGGVGTATMATCALRNDQRSSLTPGQGIVPGADSVTIGAGRGVGIFVDCSEAKWFFPVCTQAGGARNARWSVRCFDAAGVLLGSTIVVMVDHPSLTVSWNATTLCWQPTSDQTDANQGGRLCFRMPDDARTAQFMLLYAGSDITDVQSFAIYTTDPYPVRAFHGIAGGTRELTGSVSWDPPNLVTGTSTSKTTTVAGAAKHDHVLVSFSESTGNLGFAGSMQGSDTPVAVLSNGTGADSNVAPGTLTFTILKQRVAAPALPSNDNMVSRSGDNMVSRAGDSMVPR